MIKIEFDTPMPRSCWDCPVFVPIFCPATKADKGSHKVHRDIKSSELQNRPQWCPLKGADDETD